MCTTFHTFFLNCTLSSPSGSAHIFDYDPTVVTDVRSVASMELGQRTNPNSSTSRSAGVLWRSTIISSFLMMRYDSGIQSSPSLTLDASLRKIRYVWKGRKSWSSFCCSCKVHRWLMNKWADSILVIHPGASPGPLLLFEDSQHRGLQYRTLLIGYQFWRVFVISTVPPLHQLLHVDRNANVS